MEWRVKSTCLISDWVSKLRRGGKNRGLRGVIWRTRNVLLTSGISDSNLYQVSSISLVDCSFCIFDCVWPVALFCCNNSLFPCFYYRESYTVSNWKWCKRCGTAVIVFFFGGVGGSLSAFISPRYLASFASSGASQWSSWLISDSLVILRISILSMWCFGLYWPK